VRRAAGFFAGFFVDFFADFLAGFFADLPDLPELAEESDLRLAMGIRSG
jgi:hypothetical protein